MNQEIAIWDSTSGVLKTLFKAHFDKIMSLAVFPNGYLASGSMIDIIIWDMTNGSLHINLKIGKK